MCARDVGAQALSISGIPNGAKVTVICSGGGCPFAKLVYSPTRMRLSLMPSLRGIRLRPSAILTLEITKANAVGKVEVFRIRSGQAPTSTESCLPPGATHPASCA